MTDQLKTLSAVTREMTSCGAAIESPQSLHLGCILRPENPDDVFFTCDVTPGARNMEEKGMTADQMVGWHHRLNGHELV